MTAGFELLMNTNQIPVDVLSEGQKELPAMSKTGQIFTADWRMRMILAGKAHRISFGTVTGAADITLVGNGDAIELERPEGAIAIDSGFLIPMSINLAVLSDCDLENDEIDILLTCDRATGLSPAQVATCAGTAKAIDNLLDGADLFAGRYVNIGTADIVDPVHSDVLFYKHWEALGTDPLGPNNLACDHTFPFPNFLAGPCTIYLYVGGTATPTFAGSIVFAHIPSSWVPTS